MTDIKKEIILFLSLFFTGIVLLPAAIYMVGNFLFGEYADSGFAGFYGSVHGDLRSGVFVAWLLALSPYFMVIVLRIAMKLRRNLSHYENSPAN